MARYDYDRDYDRGPRYGNQYDRDDNDSSYARGYDRDRDFGDRTRDEGASRSRRRADTYDEDRGYRSRTGYDYRGDYRGSYDRDRDDDRDYERRYRSRGRHEEENLEGYEREDGRVRWDYYGRGPAGEGDRGYDRGYDRGGYDRDRDSNRGRGGYDRGYGRSSGEGDFDDRGYGRRSFDRVDYGDRDYDTRRSPTYGGRDVDPGRGYGRSGPTRGGYERGGYEGRGSNQGYYTYTEYVIIPGPMSGMGPQDYARSPSRISEQVNERLTDDGQIDASKVSVSVDEGEVTLTGTVQSRDEKRRAEDLAESVRGVGDVHNRLTVEHDKESGGESGSSSSTSKSSSTRSRKGSSSASSKKSSEEESSDKSSGS